MKKKKKSNIPRHKRMKRTSRLQATRGWISKYEGENIVRGYSKHFAVDKLCATKELQILGIHIDPEYIKQLKETLKGQEKARKLLKLQKEQERASIKYSDSDDTFYYIAGYTCGGVPYGVTWEEMGMEPYGDEDIYEDENNEFNLLITNTDGDIPF
ncbi:MAG: hypothetical protein JJT76_19260 [Clostridiaceae bacterium]|nr:hypothetical protein [Clostridiaceae bacterium]